MLPSIEKTLEQPITKNKVFILILSPNRELATQTAEQANLLCQFQEGRISCQTMVGGTNAKRDLKKITTQGFPTILLATPGRLLSHLKGSYVGNVPFSSCLSELCVLVIDEADAMLDLGFRDNLLDILSYCPPPEERQTMLFSATLDDAADLANQATKPDYVLIDCAFDNADTENTTTEQSTLPARVKQSYVFVPESRAFSAPVEVLVQLLDNAGSRPCKIIAFFPTINQVRLYESIFNNYLGRRVFAIHSKMDQSARSGVRNLFQYSQNAVLLTTDASARGVDYKDITHVIQFGMPYDRKTYIHRLGRTARAGKRGEGIMVLAPFERNFLEQSLDGIDLKHNSRYQATLESSMEPFLEDELARILAEVRDGNDRKLKHLLEEAGESMLSYYKSRGGVLENDASKQPKEHFQDSLVKMASAFLLQAGISSRPRVDISNEPKPWSHGDGFDVRRPNTPRGISG